MNRFQWKDIGEYKCLMQDFSNVEREEVQDLLKRSHIEIFKHRGKKVIVITNISGLVFDNNTTKIFSEYSERNKNAVYKSAIFGANVYHKVAIESIAKIVGREFYIFKDEEMAHKWVDDLLNENS